MNWTLPAGIAIGTGIGLYLGTHSVPQTIFGAVVAFATAAVLSFVWKKRNTSK